MKEIKYFENIINAGDLAAQPAYIWIAADGYQIARIRNSPAAIISKLKGDGNVCDFSDVTTRLAKHGVDRAVITSDVSNSLMIVEAFGDRGWKIEDVATTPDWDGSKTTDLSLYYPESIRWIDVTLVRRDSNGIKVQFNRIALEVTKNKGTRYSIGYEISVSSCWNILQRLC